MRKLFGTDGVRGKANVYPITPEVALRLGKAAAEVFKTGKERHRILIGKDTRRSSYMLENALTAGICSMGVDVLLVGPMPTPAIAHLTKSFAVDAGVMISASHNPAGDNGIKFFSPEGAKLPDEVEEQIERLFFSDEIQSEHITNGAIGRAKRIDDARGRYIEFTKASIENHSLKGIRMVLDCANGGAFCVSPYIFRELGAEVVVIHDEPDGQNINLDCGSEHPEEMRRMLLETGADIGVALDGDADRVILVDENGNDVDGDHIMAMVAIHLARQGKLKRNTIVATEMSNGGLDAAMKKEGIRVVRTQVGDRYVYDEMVNSGYNFGGEQSGHLIFLDYTSTGDGTIGALQVINLMKQTGKKLSELARVMTRFPQLLVNVPAREKIPLQELPAVMNAIENVKKQFTNGAGRVMVRYSGTQSLLRIMVEGPDEGKLPRLAESIAVEARRALGT